MSVNSYCLCHKQIILHFNYASNTVYMIHGGENGLGKIALHFNVVLKVRINKDEFIVLDFE